MIKKIQKLGPGRTIRLSALCGVIAPIFFTIMVAVESLLRPGYNQISDFISELGIGQYAFLQNANFWVFGTLVLVFVLGAVRSLSHSRGVAVSLSLFGLMIVLAGVFPENVFTSKHSSVHDVVSNVGFFSIVACQFFAWWMLRRISSGFEKTDVDWTRYQEFSFASGLASAVSLFVLSSFFQNTPYVGLAQRMFLAIVFVWIEIMAIKLFESQNVLKNSERVRRGWAIPEQRKW